MKLNELSEAKDQDLIASLAAIKRAAAIVVCEDEKIVRRTAAELQANFK